MNSGTVSTVAGNFLPATLFPLSVPDTWKNKRPTTLIVRTGRWASPSRRGTTAAGWRRRPRREGRAPRNIHAGGTLESRESGEFSGIVSNSPKVHWIPKVYWGRYGVMARLDKLGQHICGPDPSTKSFHNWVRWQHLSAILSKLKSLDSQLSNLARNVESRHHQLELRGDFVNGPNPQNICTLWAFSALSANCQLNPWDLGGSSRWRPNFLVLDEPPTLLSANADSRISRCSRILESSPGFLRIWLLWIPQIITFLKLWTFAELRFSNDVNLHC